VATEMPMDLQVSPYSTIFCNVTVTHNKNVVGLVKTW